ncbi:response regulator [Paenibacillus sp. JDR-2]|uniref:response regulator n=1 Tax=Paenibacillus sp. (strain JDR-2) TaxID=324057 RepID=UPI0001AAF8E5|nr:response regulator [Paenibacillus sp. JDR-2]ACT01212.1 two component transcriptional regulator, AraC family [Paenibacillus sp. JDR-2]
MYNVLLVDDEPLVMEGMQMLIEWENYGFTIKDTASNGFEAMEKLTREHYHLVITDIRMPEMDGLELIGQFSEQERRPAIIILSGHNEFNYAKQALRHGVNQYLLKPVDVTELTETLTSIRGQLDQTQSRLSADLLTYRNARAKMLIDLSNGHLSEHGKSVLQSRYQIRLMPHIRITMLEIVDFHCIYRNKPGDATLYKFGLHNIAEELLEQASVGYVYDDSFGRIGVILHDDLEKSMLKLRHVRSAMKSIFKTDVRIGVSRSYPLEAIAGGKQEAIQLLEAWEDGQDAVKLFVESEFETSKAMKLVWNIQALIDAVESGDKTAITDHISTFITVIVPKAVTKVEIRSLLYGIVLQFHTLCQKHGMEINDNYAKVLPEGTDHPDRLREWLIQLAYETSGRILNLNADTVKEPELIKQIVMYIHEHYQEELSLKSLAGQFYLNSAYLGQLFKQKMGEPFNDYLNKVRISEVKRLILQKPGKVMEFIRMAGYNNVEHFYRQFKRYEGISFAEYKVGKRSLMK